LPLTGTERGALAPHLPAWNSHVINTDSKLSLRFGMALLDLGAREGSFVPDRAGRATSELPNRVAPHLPVWNSHVINTDRNLSLRFGMALLDLGAIRERDGDDDLVHGSLPVARTLDVIQERDNPVNRPLVQRIAVAVLSCNGSLPDVSVFSSGFCCSDLV